MARSAALLLLAALLGGCAGLPRLGAAARGAAGEPLTWAPVAAAALLVATDADRPIADWARDHTPLFGSTDGARRASDTLRSAAVGGWALATLVAPAPEQGAFAAKLADLGVGYATLFATSAATDATKRSADRERPDGSDRLSFPSGHASRAAAAATLGMGQAHRRLRAGAARDAVDAAFLVAAFGTGWARVEAGKHHPSDVLAGWSLGRFVARTVERAWLDPEAPVAVLLTPDGAWVSVAW